MSILTIITVTKDDFEGLLKTIESTKKLREDYCIQLLVIDSSNSDLRYKIEEKIKTERNVIYRWQEPRGISSAFNFGISKSDSEWIWFINGGDTIYKGLECNFLLDYLKNSKADAIIFNTVDSETGDVLEKKPPLWAIWPPLSSWIPHPSTLVKRKLFEKFGYFDETIKLAMDYELWIRFFSKNICVDIVSIAIASFNREGASYQLNKTERAEVRRIIRKYFLVIIKKEFWSLRIILKSLIINSKFINYNKDLKK